MIFTDPQGNSYTYNWSGTIASSPKYLHRLLFRNRPVIWSWWRMIDQTVPVWERP